VIRQESIRAAADERGRPRASPLILVASGSKPKAKPAVLPASSPPPMREPSSLTLRRSQAPAGPAVAVSTSSPFTPFNDVGGFIGTGTGRSKLTAAMQASGKLRDKIMPNVMSYQMEMKNDARRKSLGLSL